MIKIILILVSILFASNVYAHSTKGHTPNLDSKRECTKKKSALNFISKHKLTRGGEIIKFNSYTGFDQRTVLTDGIKKNPIEITGYLTLPEGSGKGVTIGGKHMDEYMPQFINFFKENLL